MMVKSDPSQHEAKEKLKMLSEDLGYGYSL